MTILFKAKTNEGYIIKIMAELLQNNVRIACLKLQRDGISIRMMDSNRFVLLDLDMKNTNFNVYELSEDLTESSNEINIGVNLGHLYKMLKSIKKKDALMLSIDKNDMDNLILTIFPKESKRVIRSVIRIQPVQHICIPLPDGYKHPVIISSNDYQQTVKDMSSIGDCVIVAMKKYSLTLSCSAQGIYSKDVLFGEEEDESKEYYRDEFNMEQFTRVIKIAGLGEKIQIYGGNAQLPLKLSTQIGNLGTISIYIKSKQHIAVETK
jgi:proliferating cell nuclear antigen